MNPFKKTTNIFLQFIRYGISGGIAFAVDFFLLYILTEYADFHYLIAGTISFSVGLIITYLFSILWVFDKRRFRSRTTEFLLFVLIGIVGLLLTVVLMWLLTDMIHFHYLLAKIITTVIVTLWNFLAKKYILFCSNSLKTKYE
ncbi:hypothetical protein FACS1894178_3190 [Bacteroidia bacterium]|nr:hypothetical protein FACS1894178_3190 [Bacteroidia bacterium]